MNRDEGNGRVVMACPACQNVAMNGHSSCPACGFSVVKNDGFDVLASELALSGAEACYDPTRFTHFSGPEMDHFWFQARALLILWALEHYRDPFERFGEIGCGSGGMIRVIEQAFPDAEILGAEFFLEGLRIAAGRCKRAKLVQMDARNIPYRQHFDVLGIFDVLEHIEDDVTVLRELWKALTPGGLVLITVPQHPWLWSPTDEAACHQRRYAARDLEDKVRATGFQIVRSTSFVSLLLPALIAARLWARRKPDDGAALIQIDRTVNRVFRKVMAVELSMIRCGLNFPFGGSRLVVAQKPRS